MTFCDLKMLLDTFISIVALRHIVMNENQLTTLAANSFGSLSHLKSIQFNDNPIEAIDAEIFNRAMNLKIARFKSNVCMSESIEIEAINKDKMVQHDEKFSAFDGCFSNYMEIRKAMQKDGILDGLKLEL